MLPKLILLENNQVVSEYVIDQEIFTIGRKPENDLIIDDTAVSGRHARILIIGSDAFIEDLQSTNGTLINNKRITKQMLEDGDGILVGQHQLKFQAAASPADSKANKIEAKPYAIGMEGTAFEKPAPNPEPKPTPTPQPKPEPQRNPELEPEPAPKKPEPAPEKIEKPATSTIDAEKQEALLQLLSGPDSGKKMALTKSITRLGKPGEQVAAIARRPGGYFLMHLGGNTAQPVLNGEAVSAPVTLLNDGDVIAMGKIQLKFLLV